MLTLNIELQPEVEQRLKYLMSKQSDVEVFFKDFLQYKISQLEKAIFSIELDLRKFEKQYGISSEEFYKKFEDGIFGDEDDFMVWSGLYEMNILNKAELKKIQW